MIRIKALCTLFGVMLLAGFAIAATPVPAPDAIYFNGNIITVDAAFSTQKAFAVTGDRFTAVGSNEAVLRLTGRRTKLVDLGGATVIPGLSDNHDHLWNSGKYLHRGVDMVGVTSWVEMERRLRDAVGDAKPGGVVHTTTGWTLQPAPTRAQLDAISADMPIVVIAMRRGQAVYNGAALRRLGVSKAHPEFSGAHMPVDAQGEPSGASPHFPQSVMMIDALIPPLRQAEQDAMMMREMARRNALGITSIRELSLWPEGVHAFERMRGQGKLTLRVAMGVAFADEENAALHLAALPRLKRDDPWLFMDSQGEEPWAPAHIPVGEFTKLARAMAERGWHPTPHVGADGASETTADVATEASLAAYETLAGEGLVVGRRWSVEHVPLATPEQIARMAKLGLVVSTQDQGYRSMPNVPLPPERLAHYNPVRSFVDQGLVVIGGSDTAGPSAAEAAPNNPMIPFYFYVTRRTRSGEILTPLEKISRAEALRIFTINPAFATFQETRRGSITPGMLADFVILNQDLMTVPEEQILATRPLATFLGGRKVYAAPGAPSF